MSAIFYAVMIALEWLAAHTGFTYAEINIIVYFMLLPLLFASALDGILHRHWLKIAVVGAWVLALMAIPDFRAFSNRAFDVCAAFLNGFAVFGLGYVAASVVVCVILPGLAFAGLAAARVRCLRMGCGSLGRRHCQCPRDFPDI